MQHFMIDGFRGFRSRFDQVQLIQEVLEEVPVQLGLQTVMPAFLLPYYNGVVPEDCGISGFLFLRGGHFTVHTFSFRETYFADLLAPTAFDTRRLKLLLESAFPCETTTTASIARSPALLRSVNPDVEADFGPHLFLDIEGYEGPRTMDPLFALFDRLPGEIGMTPIMRPYVARSPVPGGGSVLSAMTMIAESHVSLHVFEDDGRAYFDLFSCRFFDRDVVVPRIKKELPGLRTDEGFTARGSKYRFLRTERSDEVARAKHWLGALPR